MTARMPESGWLPERETTSRSKPTPGGVGSSREPIATSDGPQPRNVETVREMLAAKKMLQKALFMVGPFITGRTFLAAPRRIRWWSVLLFAPSILLLFLRAEAH